MADSDLEGFEGDDDDFEEPATKKFKAGDDDADDFDEDDDDDVDDEDDEDEDIVVNDDRPITDDEDDDDDDDVEEVDLEDDAAEDEDDDEELDEPDVFNLPNLDKLDKKQKLSASIIDKLVAGSHDEANWFQDMIARDLNFMSRQILGTSFRGGQAYAPDRKLNSTEVQEIRSQLKKIMDEVLKLKKRAR